MRQPVLTLPSYREIAGEFFDLAKRFMAAASG